MARARDYLARALEPPDFVIADLVVDSESLEAVGSEALVGAIAAAAPEVWFRVFGSLPDGELLPILDRFQAAGLPVRWLLSPVNRLVPSAQAPGLDSRRWRGASAASGRFRALVAR